MVLPGVLFSLADDVATGIVKGIHFHLYVLNKEMVHFSDHLMLILFKRMHAT